MQVLVLLSALAAVQGQSGFRLANIFSDEMVLQKEPKGAQVWGFGTSGTSVTVRVNSQQVSNTVAGDGTWSVRLPAQPEGGPDVMTVTHGAEEISLNVYFGDVWLCAGQNNMELPLSLARDSIAELDKAETYEHLRLFQPAKRFSSTELDELEDVNLQWTAPNNVSAPMFSALCLMFGERLNASTGERPIGLIDASYSGSRIESWGSTRVTGPCQVQREPQSRNRRDVNDEQALWNGMINPLTKMTIRGVIWNQGETNYNWNSASYTCHLRRLVEDWRASFVNGAVPVPEEGGVAFPFGVVQLGPYSEGGDSNYGYLRWAQTANLGVLPNELIPEGFLALTYDLTERGSHLGELHPTDKQTVAARLSQAARALLYSEPEIPLNGAIPEQTLETGPGIITITYNMDIRDIDSDEPNGFSMLLPDGTWVGVKILEQFRRDVSVAVLPTATHLAYGWRGQQCENRLCAVYSLDLMYALPAHPWLWDLAQVRSTWRAREL